MIEVVAGREKVLLLYLWPFATTAYQDRQKVNAKNLQLFQLSDAPFTAEERGNVVVEKKTHSILKRHLVYQSAVVAELTKGSEDQYDHLKVLLVV